MLNPNNKVISELILKQSRIFFKRVTVFDQSKPYLFQSLEDPTKKIPLAGAVPSCCNLPRS